MLGHLSELLSSEGFMPHGMCILWRPDLLWLHAGSDALIALAYYSIPVALIYIVRRRNLELERRVAERTADLETTNDRLRAALAEKDVLLREVQHRVKNNLQVVSSLLRLQTAQAGPREQDLLRQSRDRIHSLALIHEKLHRSRDLAMVEFGE